MRFLFCLFDLLGGEQKVKKRGAIRGTRKEKREEKREKRELHLPGGCSHKKIERSEIDPASTGKGHSKEV